MQIHNNISLFDTSLSFYILTLIFITENEDFYGEIFSTQLILSSVPGTYTNIRYMFKMKIVS